MEVQDSEFSHKFCGKLFSLLVDEFTHRSMNDDAHKFTSDASETNSLENAKKLKENRLRCRILKPLLRYPFNSITKIKQRKRRENKEFFHSFE